MPRDWDDPDGWADRALEQCRSQPWSLMVPHDLPSGAMNHLEGFIDRAGKARFRTFRPTAFRSVRAKSYDPSNPM
jgi:peptidoglycan-N-acetylglucosamine deacetylase